MKIRLKPRRRRAMNLYASIEAYDTCPDCGLTLMLVAEWWIHIYNNEVLTVCPEKWPTDAFH